MHSTYALGAARRACAAAYALDDASLAREVARALREALSGREDQAYADALSSIARGRTNRA